MKSNIQIKRVYEDASHNDGTRILVDRLWPRGMSKAKLHIDAWIKELAPSTELRKWFNHDQKKFKEFEKRYSEELNANEDVWFPLIKGYLSHKITLFYAARDPEINHAVCLQSYLTQYISKL